MTETISTPTAKRSWIRWTGLILGWSWGVFAGLGGLGQIVEANVPAGSLLLLSAVAALPLTYSLVTRALKISVPIWLRVTATLTFLLIALVNTKPETNESHTSVDNQKQMATTSSESSTNANTNAPSLPLKPSAPVPAKIVDPDQPIRNAAKRAASPSGIKVSYEGLRVDAIDDDSGPPNSKQVSVEYYVPSFWDHDSLISNSGEFAADAFQKIFTADPKVYYVIVQFDFDLVDRYGHKSQGPGLAYHMDRATFAKIDWSGFDATKLCDFLREEDRLTGNNLNTACMNLAKLE